MMNYFYSSYINPTSDDYKQFRRQNGGSFMEDYTLKESDVLLDFVNKDDKNRNIKITGYRKNDNYIHNICLKDIDNLNNLDRAMIKINGYEVETIYKTDFEHLNKIHNNEKKNVIPFCLTTGNSFLPNIFDSILILLQFNNGVKSSVCADFYTCNKTDECIYYTLKPTTKNVKEFTGKEHVKKESVIRLGLSDSITDIKIECFGVLNSLIKKECLETFIIRSSYLTKLEYTNKPINTDYSYEFSLIDKDSMLPLKLRPGNVDIYLKFTTDEVSSVNIYGINRLEHGINKIDINKLFQ